MQADDQDIDAIALLGEPVRRQLYAWLSAQASLVSRDDAAAGVGISRALAAFHLDRLVQAGLLETEYRRRSGRTGPGAGRPAKLYRRADREIAITLPERRYEAAAAMMAGALEDGGDGQRAALGGSAHDAGQAVGGAVRQAAGARPSRRRRRDAILGALQERGFEPRAEASGEITLGNCPYHGLVDEYRELVCGMNLAWAQGLLEGAGELTAQARLEPQPERCCVVIGEPAGG